MIFFEIKSFRFKCSEFFFQLSVTSKLKYTARDKVIDHLTYSTLCTKGYILPPHNELSFSVLLFYQYLSVVCQPALWFTLFQFVRLLSAFAWPISSGFPARVWHGAFPLVVVEGEGETTSLYCPWSCLKLFCSLCVSHLLPLSFPKWFFLFFTFALSVNPFSPKIQKSILHTVIYTLF